MKKLLLLMTFLSTVGIVTAQVGINTKNPLGVFHLDGAADNSATPTIAQQANDVIVTGNGSVGIGTISPSAKIDIVSSTKGAIRIVDGKQGQGKILLGISSDGTASWRNMTGGWWATLEGGNLPYTSALSERQVNFTSASISQPGLGSANAGTGRITVPYNGMYRLTIIATSLMNRATGYYISGYYVIRAYNAGATPGVTSPSNAWAPHSLAHTTLASSRQVNYIASMELAANQFFVVSSIEVGGGYANAVSDLSLQVEFIQ